jgi:hypothetical protein
MSTQHDPLENLVDPDRVFYATGILLDAADFSAEQIYHRSRLARALAYLHGSGTVAGLLVEYKTEQVEGSPDPVETIEVNSGIAIDRLGRIIELPRRACIRLDRWYKAIAEREQPADPTDKRDNINNLRAAFHASPIHGVEAAVDGVVADVFLRFVTCERGKTPAFATGPFDALDAVQPSRLRDGYELKLVLREEQNPPLPVSAWPDLSAIADAQERLKAVQEAIFNSYPADDQANAKNPERPREYKAGQDETAVFLARVVIPASAPVDQASPPVRTEDAVVVENHKRLFVYRPRMLARGQSL